MTAAAAVVHSQTYIWPYSMLALMFFIMLLLLLPLLLPLYTISIGLHTNTRMHENSSKNTKQAIKKPSDRYNFTFTWA